MINKYNFNTTLNLLENYLSLKLPKDIIFYFTILQKNFLFSLNYLQEKDTLLVVEEIYSIYDFNFLNIYKNLEHNFDEQEMKDIKKCLVIGRDYDKGIVAYSLEKSSYGKIFLWLNDETLNYKMNNDDTILFALSLTSFLGKLIQQNKDNPEIYKLQEIYEKMMEKGFK